MNKSTLVLLTLLILPSLSQSCELNEKQISCLQLIAAHGPDNNKIQAILQLKLRSDEVGYLCKQNVLKALQYSHCIMQSRAESLPNITTFEAVIKTLQKDDLLRLFTALSQGKPYRTRCQSPCTIQ